MKVQAPPRAMQTPSCDSWVLVQSVSRHRARQTFPRWAGKQSTKFILLANGLGKDNEGQDCVCVHKTAWERCSRARWGCKSHSMCFWLSATRMQPMHSLSPAVSGLHLGGCASTRWFLSQGVATRPGTKEEKQKSFDAHFQSTQGFLSASQYVCIPPLSTETLTREPALIRGSSELNRNSFALLPRCTTVLMVILSQ